MAKQYFVVRDIEPNRDSHILNDDGSANMDKPVYLQGDVIQAYTATCIRKYHGTSYVKPVPSDAFMRGKLRHMDGRYIYLPALPKG